jgi:hypothetical protein
VRTVERLSSCVAVQFCIKMEDSSTESDIIAALEEVLDDSGSEGDVEEFGNPF